MKKFSQLDINDKTLPIIKELAENMPGGFFIYKADGNQDLIYFNEALVRMFGCESEEDFVDYVSNSFIKMVHPDDFPDVQKSIDRQISFSDDLIDHVAYRIIRKDGEIRWINDFGHLVHSDNFGDVFYVFVFDETETHYLKEATKTADKISSYEKRLTAISSEGNNVPSYQILENLDVLILNNNEANRLKQKAMLEQEGALVMDASSKEEASHALKHNKRFDLILVDLENRIDEAVEFINHIRTCECAEELDSIIIFATNLTDADSLKQLIQSGVNECICKPFTISDLSKALISAMRDRSNLMVKKLAYTINMANTDVLTKVKNITAYSEKISELTKRVGSEEQFDFGVMMCDINKLKVMNDTFGHDVGDTFIRNCCRLICNVFSHSPVFRIGGDEFVVILEGEDYLNIEKLLKKLDKKLLSSEAEPSFDKGRASFSYGLAIYDPNIDLTVSQVVKRADRNMYLYKNSYEDKRN